MDFGSLQTRVYTCDLMSESAILLIDGSNFYHSLKKGNYLPFGADKFQNLFAQISKRYVLKKIYYYDAVKNSEKDKEGYSRQQSFHERLKKSHPKITIKTRKLKYLVNISDDQIRDSAKRVGILDACKNKLKSFLMDLKLIRLTKEKGIDVLLVVDAIEEARAKAAENIILLSGDADFVPAIELIKSYGLKTINLHTYHGSSNELRISCNNHILIDFDSDGLVLR